MDDDLNNPPDPDDEPTVPTTPLRRAEKGDRLSEGQPVGSDSIDQDLDTTQEIAWAVDKGRVRPNNQDSLAAVRVVQASEADPQNVGLYVVADGMGGHEAGEVASDLAVRMAIRRFLEEVGREDTRIPEKYHAWLRSAVNVANEMVVGKSQTDHRDMGTTLVMAAVVGHDVHIVNVGDSRAYLISESGIQQITEDHTLVQAMVNAGLITKEEAERHPNRNVLTRAIGQGDLISIDSFQASLGENTYLLLCSDGLWGELGNEEIHRIVMDSGSARDACQNLIDAANRSGGRDNIALVLVRVRKRGA